MWVGMQQAGAGRAAEEEAHVVVGVVVALLRCAVPGDGRQGTGAVEPLGDQHPPARFHHVGYDDVGVVAVGLGILALGVGLEEVVELLDGAFLQFGDQRLYVDAGQHRTE